VDVDTREVVPTEAELTGHDIVVIGASAGGVEALGTVVASLPSDIEAAVFVVLHIPASGTSVLPAILERRGGLPAAHAVDEDSIEPGRVYIAPPDHHLLVGRETMHVTRGPKENGYRPAIDTLFRSAAQTFGPRVIGAVLSGALDDGTAGLALIKAHGGTTLVQDPEDALYPMMPASAIEFFSPDYVLPATELGDAITAATREPVPDIAAEVTNPMHEQADFIQVDRGASDHPQPGDPRGLTCPECGGALWEAEEVGVPRFRCRIGHVYSVGSLLAHHSASVEAGLWASLRALEERAAMTRRMAARARSRGRRISAERFEHQANAAVEQALVIRQALQELAPHLEPDIPAQAR
jgi:two-component system, chemotaxis family, protein-glutamate methylesterase/glutaminase